MDFPHLVKSDTCALPAIGFGTYTLHGFAGADVIKTGLDTGYRLLDTAVNYDNEGSVGAALRNSGVARDDVMIASKLPGRFHSERKSQLAIEESLMRMGLDYLDLYLIHWPLPEHDRYVDAWAGLIAARERGLVRHIGVSNFLAEHLERLVNETGVLPEVNQIEIHPYFPQNEVLADHDTKGILTQAWSPLGRGSSLLIDPVVTKIASKHANTPAQVVLRWHIQRGVVPIPKASTAERQAENFDVFDFELDADDMAQMASLARDDGRLWGGDPRTYVEM